MLRLSVFWYLCRNFENKVMVKEIATTTHVGEQPAKGVQSKI